MRKAKFHGASKTGFYPILQRRVRAYFLESQKSAFADKFTLFKILLIFILYFSIYFILILDLLPVEYVLPGILIFGFSNALIGLNVSHDAIHNALFKSSRLNAIFAYSFDLIGISSYVWKLKHNIIHHNYPNLQNSDFDIEAGPILRLSPADKLESYHRYQHLYATLVYVFFSMSLIFISDLKIMFFTRRESIDGKPHPKFQKFVFIISKAFYVFTVILLPLMLLPYGAFEIILGFMLMHFSLSLVLAFVLLPAHLFEHAVFPKKNEAGYIQEDWAVYQMRTTIDYSRKNPMLNLLFGGFNLNVIHHLFPRICHCHLIAISEIVKRTADEFGIPYNEMGYMEAIISHFKILKLLGKTEDPTYIDLSTSL